jgi:putative restriction endonuclease
MKCCNLAALDETHLSRGVRGLAKTSQLDREIWSEFESRPEAVCFEAAQVLANYGVHQTHGPNQIDEPGIEGLDREAVVRVRVNQGFFRTMILVSYETSCAVCRIRIPELLVAAHIVPWAIDPTTRMNPRNGICLCGTHDLAFERGLLLIQPNYIIQLSSKVRPFENDPPVQDWLTRYSGSAIRSPERWLPDPMLLARRVEIANVQLTAQC